MKRNPKISVILPVFNGERFLCEAVESILTQTYGDFELIIIDDASSDSTPEIISSFNDKRIISVRNEINMGITYSLNRGIEIARGDYIARLDADDISSPDRFEKQSGIMDRNKDILLCGSRAKVFGSVSYIAEPPTSYWYIRSALLFGNIFVHSSVMFRRNVYGKYVFYAKNCKYAEDYELWCRIAKLGRVVNLSDILVFVRSHGAQKTADYGGEKSRNVFFEVKSIFKRELMQLGIDASDSDLNKHARFAILPFVPDTENFPASDLSKWVRMLVEYNKEKNIYDDEIFSFVTAGRWLAVMGDIACCGDRNDAKFWLDILSGDKRLLPVTRYRIASLYKKLGFLSEARDIFSTFCLEKNRDLFDGVQFHLGEIALRESRVQDAVYHFKTALALNSRHRKSREYLRKL